VWGRLSSLPVGAAFQPLLELESPTDWKPERLKQKYVRLSSLTCAVMATGLG